jgi:hypothetical protein
VLCVVVYIYIFGSEVFNVASFIFKFRSPEGEVISDQLHDRCGILVLVFLDRFDIGDSVIESLLVKLVVRLLVWRDCMLWRGH